VSTTKIAITALMKNPAMRETGRVRDESLVSSAARLAWLVQNRAAGESGLRLTHVNGAVQAHHRSNYRKHTDHARESNGIPSAAVIISGEGGACADGRQDPKRDHDDDADQMQHDKHAFDHGKPLGEDGVEENGDDGDAHGKKRAVPVLGNVVGIVQND
jgi:hypothetical protein